MFALTSNPESALTPIGSIVPDVLEQLAAGWNDEPLSQARARRLAARLRAEREQLRQDALTQLVRLGGAA